MPRKPKFVYDRICEICGRPYQTREARTRSCRLSCGMFVRYGWPTASEVNWRTCPVCQRPYTPRGRRRCGCGYNCTDCGAAISLATITGARPGRALCYKCAPRRDRTRRDLESYDRRRLLLMAQREPVDRLRVYERDGWRCQLCDKAVDPSLRHPSPFSASLDHVVPVALGGDHTYANVQLAHLRCNMLKKHRGDDQQLALI